MELAGRFEQSAPSAEADAEEDRREAVRLDQIGPYSRSQRHDDRKERESSIGRRIPSLPGEPRGEGDVSA
ncbi:hypothetical protein ACE1SV_73660 [Streptomyces sennicomposti]